METNYKIPGWKLPVGESAILIAISNPYTRESTRRHYCKVNFEKKDHTFFYCECSWGNLYHYIIGGVYKDGIFQYVVRNLARLDNSFFIKDYSKQRVISYKDLPKCIQDIPYFNLKQIPGFTYCPTPNMDYYIPSIEIFRSFFSLQPVLANSIFSLDDLSSVFTESAFVLNNCAYISFLRPYASYYLPVSFIPTLAFFLLDSKITYWLKMLQIGYSRHKTVDAAIPHLFNMKINGNAIRIRDDNKTHILLLNLSYQEIVPDFNNIVYCDPSNLYDGDDDTIPVFSAEKHNSYIENDMTNANANTIHLSEQTLGSSLQFKAEPPVKKTTRTKMIDRIKQMKSTVTDKSAPITSQPSAPGGTAMSKVNSIEQLYTANQNTVENKISNTFPTFKQIADELLCIIHLCLCESRFFQLNSSKHFVEKECAIIAIDVDSSVSTIIEIEGETSSTLITHKLSESPELTIKSVLECYTISGWNGSLLDRRYCGQYHLLKHANGREITTWKRLIRKYIS